MTRWHSPLAQRTGNGLSAPRSSRFVKCLGATLFAGALALGATTAAVAEEPSTPTGAACPEDTFCVDSTNKTTVDNVPELTLGDGQDGPFALSPGDSIRGGFDVKNTGSREARVVVTMAWTNERCVGASFADDPFLMSLPHPGGKTTFYSPGMDAKVDYSGGSMVAESLRCNGTRETAVLTVAPGETLTFDARIAFPFMENGNDTQKEKVSIDFRIKLEVDDPTKIPVPAAPGVNDPCGPDNATWQVPENTEQLDWTLAADGTLSVTPKPGFEFEGGEASHSFGKVQDSGVACPTPMPSPTPSVTPTEVTPSPTPSVTPTPEPSSTSSGAPGGSTLPTGQPTGEPSASGTPAPSVAPSRPSRPGLAATGVNLTGVAVGVGGLVVAGGLLLLVRRRKRQD